MRFTGSFRMKTHCPKCKVLFDTDIMTRCPICGVIYSEFAFDNAGLKLDRIIELLELILREMKKY